MNFTSNPILYEGLGCQYSIIAENNDFNALVNTFESILILNPQPGLKLALSNTPWRYGYQKDVGLGNHLDVQIKSDWPTGNYFLQSPNLYTSGSSTGYTLDLYLNQSLYGGQKGLENRVARLLINK